VMNVNVLPEQASALTALTDGMNLNGNLSVEKGTTILSGQPVAHAGALGLMTTGTLHCSKPIRSMPATVSISRWENTRV